MEWEDIPAQHIVFLGNKDPPSVIADGAHLYGVHISMIAIMVRAAIFLKIMDF